MYAHHDKGQGRPNPTAAPPPAASSAIADRLVAVDPANAPVYRATPAAKAERIAAPDRELEAKLAPVTGELGSLPARPLRVLLNPQKTGGNG